MGHNNSFIYKRETPLLYEKKVEIEEAAQAITLDAASLKQVCLQDFERFVKAGGEVTRDYTKLKGNKMDEPHRHIFYDNGASVLAVAHLDSVRHPGHFWMNHQFISCPTIDNRLGAWIITHWLPSQGITTDILLTEGEETGKTTARDFVPPEGKKYNWMFSFDRMGADVACYQYLSSGLEKILEPYGLPTVKGSFSDIASLSDLGCSGINVGCAMYDYHNEDAYANIKQLKRQLAAFSAFYADHKDTYLEYKIPPAPSYPKHQYDKWEDWEGDGGYGTYNQRTLFPSAIEYAKTTDTKKALEMYEMIAKEGPDSPAFSNTTPRLWHSMNKAHTRGKAAPFRMMCKACEYYFEYNDTIYSHTLTVSMCRLCFMEMMSLLEYVPPDWYKLALTRKEWTSDYELGRAALEDFNRPLAEYV